MIKDIYTYKTSLNMLENCYSCHDSGCVSAISCFILKFCPPCFLCCFSFPPIGWFSLLFFTAHLFSVSLFNFSLLLVSSAFSFYSPHLCCSTCVAPPVLLHLCCSTCLHLHLIPSSVVSSLCHFVLCSPLCNPPLFLLFFLVGTLCFCVCSSWFLLDYWFSWLIKLVFSS